MLQSEVTGGERERERERERDSDKDFHDFAESDNFGVLT
jgi:hypothetical protein